jgi:hypothetical protein
MSAIFEYALSFESAAKVCAVQMPLGAKIVHFDHTPHYKPDTYHLATPTRIWAIVDGETQQETRRFQAVPTGRAMPAQSRYVGSWSGAGLSWHVVELVGRQLPKGVNLPDEYAPYYWLLVDAGFRDVRVDSGGRWVAPDDEPMTREQMIAVAELQAYGFGAVVSK